MKQISLIDFRDMHRCADDSTRMLLISYYGSKLLIEGVATMTTSHYAELFLVSDKGPERRRFQKTLNKIADDRQYTIGDWIVIKDEGIHQLVLIGKKGLLLVNEAGMPYSNPFPILNPKKIYETELNKAIKEEFYRFDNIIA
jgi:hypothetical protein